jgi:hypothetical protein
MSLIKFLLFYLFFKGVCINANILGTPIVFFEEFIKELNLDFIMVIKNDDLGDELLSTKYCVCFHYIISKVMMIKRG